MANLVWIGKEQSIRESRQAQYKVSLEDSNER